MKRFGSERPQNSQEEKSEISSLFIHFGTFVIVFENQKISLYVPVDSDGYLLNRYLLIRKMHCLVYDRGDSATAGDFHVYDGH